MIPASDDTERSDEEERRMIPASDDAERRDGVGALPSSAGTPPACGGERRS
jgi:hypothetical protein